VELIAGLAGSVSTPLGVPEREESARLDREALERVRSGDPSGAEPLFDRWSRPLLRFCSRMLGNDAEGEEVAQEVFLRMIRRAEQYDGRAPVGSWLFAIAANACRDRLRRGGRQLPLEAAREAEAPGEGVLARLIDDERRRRVRSALAALTGEQREALLLARYEGLRYSEIARVLGITENAVKTRIFRAMEILKDRFSGETES
jgi:RNA polymerase sigma-70 factor (ECF subfamily)